MSTLTRRQWEAAKWLFEDGEDLTTWREYHDKLTPEQITKLQKEEDENGGAAHTPYLIDRARGYAGENIVADHKRIWNGPDPADAQIGRWQTRFSEPGCGEEPFRTLTGSSWVTGDIRVQVAGVQKSNGQIDWWVDIVGETDHLASEVVQALSENLVAAHAEIERRN